MSQEEPTIQDPSPQTPVQASDVAAYEPGNEEREEWLDAPTEPELPRRPRRRLLGAGANPLPLALIGVLLTACGFIGGVLVEKGQSSSSNGSTSAAGLASRFAALRSGGSSSGATSGAGASSSGVGAILGGSGGDGGTAASAGGRAGATFGQVAYVSGHTLYVTDAEGNTVKVTTSAASTVTKTVKADVKSIHPGETVVVTGSPGANGSVKAETIRISEAGALGGGLGALFGGGGSGTGFGAARGDSEGASRGGGTSAGGGGGEQALFGK